MMATGESKSPARALRRLVGAAVASVLLRGSFSASKCKTEARMATARMKLLRNRREAQVRQMRRDIAALLRDRQEDTARIRVEHVIREQNIMAANDIIELFCELIVTRLPIIAKQKECPADLKEGICSLIFAAPRCSELPELSRMCDLFEKKYGKDFVSAAVDLRPNAGVNNLLIEKLSVKKPSGQTKLKVLKEISKEHQIDWDTTETEQELLKPPEELIQGPSTFVEASKMPVKTTLQAHVVQPIPANFSPVYADEYDNGGNMQFKDAASAARAAAESAGRAASAAKAAADLANKNTHRFDKVEDCKPSDHEFTNSSKRQSMSNSSRSSRKEDVVAFDELKPYGGKTSSTGSFSGSNRVENKDTDPVDLGTRKIHKRNSRAARKVHSEIKFDDSEGLNSETEDESDVEIRSVERPPPRREPYARTHHSEEKELDHDLGTRKIHKRNSPAARKAHSEIKFDDSEGLNSEGLNSETEDESDVEIRSVERPPPRREPYTRTHHSEEKELDHDFPDLPKANLGSRVHPNMPLDYETLTARFEALKSGKLP